MGAGKTLSAYICIAGLVVFGLCLTCRCWNDGTIDYWEKYWVYHEMCVGDGERVMARHFRQ